MRYGSPLSVQSYDEAKRWLWANARPHEWLDDPDHLPLLARFVCDMFWISEQQLVKDLRKTWYDTLDVVRPVSHRRNSSGWWR